MTQAMSVKVSTLELRPLVRLMVKPAPQFGGGSSFLRPEIDLRVLLRETAGPQPFDKNAEAIRS